MRATSSPAAATRSLVDGAVQAMPAAAGDLHHDLRLRLTDHHMSEAGSTARRDGDVEGSDHLRLDRARADSATTRRRGGRPLLGGLAVASASSATWVPVRGCACGYTVLSVGHPYGGLHHRASPSRMCLCRSTVPGGARTVDRATLRDTR
jgi:hypothetical protein